MSKRKLAIFLIISILASSLFATSSYEYRSGAFTITAYKMASNGEEISPQLSVVSTLKTIEENSNVLIDQTSLQHLVGTESDLTDTDSLDATKHILFSYRVFGNTDQRLEVSVKFGGTFDGHEINKFTQVTKDGDNYTYDGTNQIDFWHSLRFTEYSFNKEPKPTMEEGSSWPPGEYSSENPRGELIRTDETNKTITVAFTPPTISNASNYVWVARGIFSMVIDETSFNAAPAGSYLLPIVVTMRSVE